MFKFLLIFFISFNLNAKEHQDTLKKELQYWKDLLDEKLIDQEDYEKIKLKLISDFQEPNKNTKPDTSSLNNSSSNTKNKKTSIETGNIEKKTNVFNIPYYAYFKNEGKYFCPISKGLNCDENDSGMLVRKGNAFYMTGEVNSNGKKYYVGKLGAYAGSINSEYLNDPVLKRVEKDKYDNFFISYNSFYDREMKIINDNKTKYVTIKHTSSPNTYIKLFKATHNYKGYIAQGDIISLKTGTELEVIDRIISRDDHRDFRNKEFYVVRHNNNKYLIQSKYVSGEASDSISINDKSYAKNKSTKNVTSTKKKKETPEEKALRIKRSQFLMKLGNSLMNGQGVAGALNDFNSSSYNQNKNLEPTFDETPGWGMLIESYPSGLNTLCLYDTNRGVFTKTLNTANAVCPPTL